MQVKFNVFWKKNLGTLYKDNSIDTVGKEANVEVLLCADDYIDELHYWTVDNPNLYDVRLTLFKDEKILDTVDTYFGFRKIHVVEIGDICLNNKKIYLLYKYKFEKA